MDSQGDSQGNKVQGEETKFSVMLCYVMSKFTVQCLQCKSILLILLHMYMITLRAMQSGYWYVSNFEVLSSSTLQLLCAHHWLREISETMLAVHHKHTVGLV